MATDKKKAAEANQPKINDRIYIELMTSLFYQPKLHYYVVLVVY